HQGECAMSSTAAVKESEVEQIDHVLGEEYEHMPVPAQARRSLFSVTMVWIGFPMIITGAMTGSVLVLGMGFQRALIAMIIGNLINRLVTEKFGIKKIPLVTGWSMGALQTFHWGALYPDMVERIAPFCGSAKCSRHNFVFLEGVKAALTADAVFADGWYKRSRQKACGRWRASMPVGDFRRPSIASSSTSNAWAIPRLRISWSPSG